MADNQELVFDFKAGRGETGPSATLEIKPAGMVAEMPTTAPKANITATPEARKEPETKSASKPSFNIGKKEETEVEPQDTKEDESSDLDDRGNSMTNDPNADEPAKKEAPASSAPRGIFSKASNG